MNRVMWFSALSLALALLWSGCGRKEEPPPPPPTPAIVEPAAAPAPKAAAPTQPAAAGLLQLTAEAKAAVDKAMALAKEGKYNDALTLLQQKLAQVQNNPEAKKLLDDAIAQVKKMMAEAAAAQAAQKVEGAATKAVGDLFKK